MKLAVILALSLGLVGCNGLNQLAKNPACTTKVNGKTAFGAGIPTGTLNFSAVCKAAETAPPAAEVTDPKAPT